MEREKIRIGVVGTGFISRGFITFFAKHQEFQISCVLTRRNRDSVLNMPVAEDRISNDPEKLIQASDMVFECSGDPVYATPIVAEALQMGKPVITMDSELQITTGSWLKRLGYITEAEGDQPGCEVALAEEAQLMGFKPRVYGNIKGFLNSSPAEEEMRYWANKGGISLDQVTSFTDGTKVHIEQVLVANGMGADIFSEGILGLATNDLQTGAFELANLARERSLTVCDYVLSPQSPPGVFIVGEHDIDQAPFLKYYKLGEGSFYMLIKPYHLCHLEVMKTIRRVLCGLPPLLNNGDHPRYSVAAAAKRDLYPGERIKRGLGSFEFRGVAVGIPTHLNNVPIGLLFDGQIARKVEQGNLIEFSDIELPESLALRVWRESILSSATLQIAA